MSPTFSCTSPSASCAPSPCPHSSPIPLALALPNELPISRPLSLFILTTLTLPNKCPITSIPLVDFLGDDGDNAFLATHPPLSPVTPHSSHSVVEDNTTLNRGVKTLTNSVSTSRTDTSCNNTPLYPPLFLSCACKRPRNPDEIELATTHHQISATHHNGSHPEDEPNENTHTHCMAIVPPDHPLHKHAHAKREQEYDGDDELCKPPHKQLARKVKPVAFTDERLPDLGFLSGGDP
ncbi:hypothetical protein EDB92DRAFT_1956794 [Lactarius akahatsu]|uniref:Uncharacterized protein n=1 Tax=Lactarius akahatsu TaxID=416441 RepID=A0AAD4Q4Y3_9AGAM|nr:hypothetical protein EDB92DRAFT_1956794 [Lactarius akahatsu]